MLINANGMKIQKWSWYSLFFGRPVCRKNDLRYSALTRKLWKTLHEINKIRVSNGAICATDSVHVMALTSEIAPNDRTAHQGSSRRCNTAEGDSIWGAHEERPVGRRRRYLVQTDCGTSPEGTTWIVLPARNPLYWLTSEIYRQVIADVAIIYVSCHFVHVFTQCLRCFIVHSNIRNFKPTATMRSTTLNISSMILKRHNSAVHAVTKISVTSTSVEQLVPPTSHYTYCVYIYIHRVR